MNKQYILKSFKVLRINKDFKMIFYMLFLKISADVQKHQFVSILKILTVFYCVLASINLKNEILLIFDSYIDCSFIINLTKMIFL
jgi:hypothetical protein